MEHLSKEFLLLPTTTQSKVVSLGLTSWHLIQDEVDSQKDMDQSTLIEIWKEKGRKEVRNEKDKEHQRLMKDVQSERDDILHEKNTLERKLLKLEKDTEEKLRKEFERDKEHLLREARLALKEEMGSIKDENVKLKNLL